ncbi:WD40-repeat-containing domain protein [Coprinopsis sp. MPI-PUGE-AT-0042]|nr:WD40-repeat-containing domain protein [Coprinopsis sp. MPI-PUGE-AT-0042]
MDPDNSNPLPYHHPPRLSMSGYTHRLEQQALVIEDIQSSIFDQLAKAARNETASLKDEYLNAVSQCFAIVKEAYDTKPENLEEILEQAEDILSDAVIFAYQGNEDRSSETQVFSQFPSFAHEDGSRPLIKWTSLPEGYHSHLQAEMLQGMGRILGPQYAKQFKEKFKSPPQWKETPHPHPLSSPCARFVDGITDEMFTGAPPRALSILQGRFEFSNNVQIALPGNVSVSKDGNGFILEMHGGWKQREPFIKYYSFVDEDRRGSLSTGLEGLTHSCFDHGRFLIVGGDEDRMKVWTMAPPDYEGRGDTLPLHTMDTEGFPGAIAFLPNNRIARAGKGELAVWNMSDLPTHGPDGQDIIGEDLTDEEVDPWGPEPDEVENSGGTPPHSTQQLPWKEYNIGRWHPHPCSPNVMLCATGFRPGERYYCHAIDLDHGSKVSARYLGIGGDVVGFSTSQGDPNCFTVASTDGFVRMYDYRTLLPALTIKVSPQDDDDFKPSAVLCHPNGFPLLFSAAFSEECVKLWDLRSNAPVYEMSTGNNQVEAMAWNDKGDELFAITQNINRDRMGGLHREDYRRARLTYSQTRSVHGSRWAAGEDSDEEDDSDHDLSWPKKAFHAENYWGHVFDEAEHTIFKYSFKENPDPTVVPAWEEFCW